jgi:hypothetical protein
VEINQILMERETAMQVLLFVACPFVFIAVISESARMEVERHSSTEYDRHCEIHV